MLTVPFKSYLNMAQMPNLVTMMVLRPYIKPLLIVILGFFSNHLFIKMHSFHCLDADRAVRVLLQHGVYVNIKTKHDWAPLHSAASHSNSDKLYLKIRFQMPL